MRRDVGHVVRGREGADPRVEQLDGADPGGDLQTEMRHDDVQERGHQRVPRRGLAQHERLRSGVIAAGTPLHEVAGQRERRSREPDQRHVELGHEGSDRLGHVRLVDVGLQRPEAPYVGGRADRRIQDGTEPLLHADRQPGGRERNHDVTEQDRGVHRHPAERLQRDLDHLVRQTHGLQDVPVAADLPVLGQVPAGLPHEPHGGPVDGLAPEGTQQAVVRGGHGAPGYGAPDAGPSEAELRRGRRRARGRCPARRRRRPGGTGSGPPRTPRRGGGRCRTA